MKRQILTLAIGSALIGNAHAFTVYDPTLHAQSILNTAQEIAKFVEMINNQVEQIQTLGDHLDEFQHYKELFGDPKAVVLPTVKPLTDDLRKTEPGQTLAILGETANATEAMLYDAAGLYHRIGTTFTTPKGRTVTRVEAPYLPVAAVQKTTDNYLSVSTDAAARRVALKEQIAATTELLRNAATDADVQKLTGVLIGLSAALDSTGHELHQAAASSIVQDIANRADERRQTEARKEQQHAEFAEAVGNYGNTFRLMNEPVSFPTR
jgi:hypothetical protein